MKRTVWFTIISFICLVITMATLQEMDLSVNDIENMDQIGAAILVFLAMTIGGVFWMGFVYWNKTFFEISKLQNIPAAPKTIERYYNKLVKIIHKVGVSMLILSMMLDFFSQLNSVFEIVGTIVFILGIVLYLLSLGPKSLAKQILKQSHK